MQWIDAILPFFDTSNKDVLWFDKDFLLRHDELKHRLIQQEFQIIYIQNALDARIWFELHLKKEPNTRYLLVSQTAINLLPDMQITKRKITYSDFITHFDTNVCKTMDANTIDDLYKLDKKQFQIFNLSETHKKLSSHSFEQWFEQNRLRQAKFDDLLLSLDDFRSSTTFNIRSTNFWEILMPMMAKIKQLSLQLDTKEVLQRINLLEQTLNADFQIFITETHFDLANRQAIQQPYSVCGFLDHIHFQNKAKKALLIIDGLNWWQWNMLQTALQKQDIGSRAYCSFAWLPSITAWSRQAILKGKIPNLSENNSKEKQLFEQYWVEKGIATHQVAYTKLDYKSEIVYPDVTHLAIVINDIDEMLHGSIMGNIQLINATEKWIEKGNIIPLIKKLKSDGYSIFLSADHGNVEAIGVRNLTLQEKVGNQSRSKRHISFPNTTLAKKFAREYPIENIGQIENSLYLRNSEAFTLSEQTVVTHGGSHFWEITIPFVVL